MKALLTRLKLDRWPLFLYFLPIFFVLHGFEENYHLIPIPDTLLLTLKYLLWTLFLNFILFFIFRRNNHRASFFLFSILCIYFFFGAFHDLIKSAFPGTFFSKYTFVLPLIVLIAIASFVIIYRKKLFTRQIVYLNILFLILIFSEIAILVGKVSKYDKQRQLQSIDKRFTFCDTCNKPDIYLIVADEYAGEKTLRDLYDFDNSAFLDQLKERNFSVIKNSISNYNVTPISIASLLNLDYIDYKGNSLSNIPMAPVYNTIDTNILVRFLRFCGYHFANNSVFTVGGEPPFATQSFTPVNTRIIESQTLTKRIMKDLGFYLIKWHLIKNKKEDNYTVLNNNNKIIDNIKAQVIHKTKNPLFSYSHLTMPHFPYYFNRNGQPYPSATLIKETEWYQDHFFEDHYLEYLLYTNQTLIDLVDFIKQHSAKPPVIILISDHGFRHYSKKVHEEYDFYNLIATFLPGQYKGDFKEGMSNISYMRSLMNLLFGQEFDVSKQEKYYIPMPITYNGKN